jgi:hypothetical protein
MRMDSPHSNEARRGCLEANFAPDVVKKELPAAWLRRNA